MRLELNVYMYCLFFKQKTAYEMRISDWSSDVCSSDLPSFQEGVNRRTTRLATELNAFFAQRGVKIHIAHFASQMFIRVQEAGELATLLFYHLRDRGIHVLENFPSYLTAAHSDEDVERIIAAVKDSVLEMQADDILPRRSEEHTSELQ